MFGRQPDTSDCLHHYLAPFAPGGEPKEPELTSGNPAGIVLVRGPVFGDHETLSLPFFAQELEERLGLLHLAVAHLDLEKDTRPILRGALCLVGRLELIVLEAEPPKVLHHLAHSQVEEILIREEERHEQALCLLRLISPGRLLLPLTRTGWAGLVVESLCHRVLGCPRDGAIDEEANDPDREERERHRRHEPEVTFHAPAVAIAHDVATALDRTSYVPCTDTGHEK